MPLPPKEYFALEEMEERWNMRRRDLVYYAENSLLEVSTRVRGVVIEAGTVEAEPDGQWFKILEERTPYAGLLPLCERDLSEVFRFGVAQVHCFRAEPGRYREVHRPEEGIEVSVGELVVAREERDRFEREHGLVGDTDEKSSGSARMDESGFSQRDDYAEVTLDGHTYRLGTCQAAVARQLHQAIRRCSPWCPGKVLLHRAGSTCTRMRDLFKTQPDWRRLILSDGRGRYRLNLPWEEPPA